MRSGKKLISILGSVILVAGFSACNDLDRDGDVTPDRPAATDTERTSDDVIDNEQDKIGDILENPSAYTGKTVTVVSDVQEVYGNYGFTLDEESLTAGGIDNDMLVLFGKTATHNLGAIDDQIVDDTVVVSGTVKNLAVTDIERDLGIDLTPEIERNWNNKPVLIANSIKRASEDRAGL